MASCRSIVHPLKFAEECEWPSSIPKPKKQAISGKVTPKTYGLRYEKAVAGVTGGRHGQWFRFADAWGEGFCQTDVLLMLDGEVIILECKLTEVDAARSKLAKVYIPVVAKAYGRPVKGIVVARYLTCESKRANVYSKMGHAIAAASASFYPTLHWIGKGPI